MELAFENFEVVRIPEIPKIYGYAFNKEIIPFCEKIDINRYRFYFQVHSPI